MKRAQITDLSKSHFFCKTICYFTVVRTAPTGASCRKLSLVLLEKFFARSIFREISPFRSTASEMAREGHPKKQESLKQL